MITGNIGDCEKYYSVNKYFKEAFEILKNYTSDCFENYKSDYVTINTSDTVTCDILKDGTPKPFEAHRNYLDIHYVIDGEEGFGYSNIKDLTPTTEYNSDGDYQLFKGVVNSIVLKKGDFCIVFPEDAHIPCMNTDKEHNVKRCVVKIPV